MLSLIDKISMKMKQSQAALDPSLPEQQPLMTMAKITLIIHHPTRFNAILGIPAGLGCVCTTRQLSLNHEIMGLYSHFQYNTEYLLTEVHVT
jgi:hypothetical protein